MTNAQQVLLDYINLNHRVPSVDESIDMYTEHCLKSEVRCIWTNRGRKMLDYRYWELKGRACSWVRQSIGSLVLQGELKIEGVSI